MDATSSKCGPTPGRTARLAVRAPSVAAVVVVGHALYLAVFAPHLITKLRGDVTAGPNEQLFPGVRTSPSTAAAERLPQRHIEGQA